MLQPPVFKEETGAQEVNDYSGSRPIRLKMVGSGAALGGLPLNPGF